MRRHSLVLAAVLLSGSLSAHAATHWLCGLSADMTRLVCLADIDPLRAAVTAEPTVPGVVVNGTRFPLDARRLYTVDFWSPATDLAFVDRLARATLCYRSPGCEVSFTAPSEHHARRSAQSGE